MQHLLDFSIIILVYITGTVVLIDMCLNIHDIYNVLFNLLLLGWLFWINFLLYEGIIDRERKQIKSKLEK